VLKDVFTTSTANDDLMSGPEIQAAAIQTVLDGFPLRAAPGWLDGLLIVLLGSVGAVATARLGPARGALTGLAVALGFAVAAQLAFGAGLIVAVLHPLVALVLGVTGAVGVAAVVHGFERERVRDLFSRFVPEAVVDDVLARVDDELRLGGERRVVTVLFSDIRGFTRYSEERTPEEVIEVLNRYLTVMSNVILDHGGTLIAYMGDGIMAVFGAPTEQVDHADRALAAAEQMAGPALEEVNAWIRARGGQDFKIGIGLNSGPVMAGNVGSERRMEYTTIGDTTNTAARLETMTKGTGHTIFLADSVRQMLTREHGEMVRVAEMQVRGKEEPVVVWSVA
jgi:adenylate cyclase